MEGNTGVRDGYFRTVGKCYAELVLDVDVVRLGIGLMVRRSSARITLAVGPARLVVGYLRVPRPALALGESGAGRPTWVIGERPRTAERLQAIELERHTKRHTNRKPPRIGGG